MWGYTDLAKYSKLCVPCRDVTHDRCPACGLWVKKGSLMRHKGGQNCRRRAVRHKQEKAGLSLAWANKALEAAGVPIVTETIRVEVTQHFAAVWAVELYNALHSRFRHTYLPPGEGMRIRRKCEEILRQCMESDDPEQHAKEVHKLMELGE